MLHTPDTFSPLIRSEHHDEAFTFVVHRGELLLRNNILGVPDAAALAALAPAPERIHALGELEGRYYQMAWLDDTVLPAALQADYGWHGLRALFGVVDDGFLGLAGRAMQLAEWARTHRYCGVCSTAMQLLAGERCYKCPHCGHSAYPRISPAMMVLIRKGDSVLLALHTNSPYQR